VRVGESIGVVWSMVDWRTRKNQPMYTKDNDPTTGRTASFIHLGSYLKILSNFFLYFTSLFLLFIIFFLQKQSQPDKHFLLLLALLCVPSSLCKMNTPLVKLSQ
jgi:hypothetical protein